MEIKKKDMNIQEKAAKAQNGFVMLALAVAALLLSTALIVVGGVAYAETMQNGGLLAVAIVAGVLIFLVGVLLLTGLKIVNPNEAIVLTLFGKYYGTLKTDGFFWVNPFAVSARRNRSVVNRGMDGSVSISGGGVQKISLKANTLNNEKQTVNDERGNPIIIGTIVIWRVVDTAKAVFSVQDFKSFLSTQCDSATRNIARQYPYDLLDDANSDEKTLRGSSQEIAEMMQNDLQKRVEIAGLKIEDVRITNLTYAPEIAAAMLQRQQAEAVVAARKKIVEGAVGMVEMALEQLNEKHVVELDEERRAAMVSNLLVVLCGNKDAQPVVNSGSLY